MVCGRFLQIMNFYKKIIISWLYIYYLFIEYIIIHNDSEIIILLVDEHMAAHFSLYTLYKGGRGGYYHDELHSQRGQ